MAQAEQPASRPGVFKGATGLIVAVALVGALLLWLPAYRWFLAVSVGLGLVVAGILYLWNKYRPVKAEDVENKRPLGLD